jgi:membrane protein DedA with SNARE-associated domain
LLGMAWTGWFIWVFLVFIFGRHHAEPLDQITKLDSRRTILAILGLIIFVLVFIPVPLRIISGPYVGP